MVVINVSVCLLQSLPRVSAVNLEKRGASVDCSENILPGTRKERTEKTLTCREGAQSLEKPLEHQDGCGVPVGSKGEPVRRGGCSETRR